MMFDGKPKSNGRTRKAIRILLGSPAFLGATGTLIFSDIRETEMF